MAMMEGVTSFVRGHDGTKLSWGVPIDNPEWDDLVADVDATTRRLVAERNPIPDPDPDPDALVHHLAQAAFDNVLAFERDPEHQGFERIIRVFVQLIARYLGSTKFIVRLDDHGTVDSVEVT